MTPGRWRRVVVCDEPERRVRVRVEEGYEILGEILERRVEPWGGDSGIGAYGAGSVDGFELSGASEPRKSRG